MPSPTQRLTRAAHHPDSNDDVLRADTATAVQLLQETAKLPEPAIHLLDEDWATNDWLGRLPEKLFARGLLDEDGRPDEADEVRAQWEAWRRRAEREQGGPSAPRTVMKARRNDPCPCGSGRKYKRCCAP